MSFPKEGGEKSPDILVQRNGLVIAVECKRLGDEQWEDWESNLLQEISFALPKARDGVEVAIEVVLDPRLSDFRFGSLDQVGINAAITAAIKREILVAINGALEEVPLPVRIEVLEIASIVIQRKTVELSSSARGVERSTSSVFRRIFQNGVLRALEQLPREKPGVVFIFSKYAPPPALFRVLFDAITQGEREKFSDLIGILICTRQTLFDRPKPIYYANVRTDHPSAVAVVEQVMVNGFGALVG